MSIKIIDVEAIWLRVPKLDEYCEWGEDAFIVKIYTDAGIVGIGESDSSPAVLHSIIETPASHSNSRGLKEILIGENPLHIQRIWDLMYEGTSYMGRRGAVIHAMSAIDIALWDILSQYTKVPIHVLLGGKRRDFIDAYGTFIPGSEKKQLINSVDQLKAQGLKSFKVGGANFGFDTDNDISTLKVIREAAGDEMDIAIDVVYRWKNYDYAMKQINSLREFNLSWVEEPLPSDAHIELRRLSENSPTCITGGEGLSTAPEFKEFISKTRPGIVQPDITRCGGISEMRKISHIAQDFGARLVPHGFSTGILLSATVQFLASEAHGTLIEYSQSTSPLFTDLVTNMIPLVNGQVKVPDHYGLGIELDEDLIKKYRVKV